MRLADRQKLSVTVGHLDIDGPKAVNDRLGHEQGDGLIREVADLLAQTFRDADVTARLGGDEFAVAFFDSDEMRAPTVFARLTIAVADRNGRGRLPFSIAVSARWVTRESGGADLVDLLTAADESMYRHKLGSRDAPAD